MISQATIDRFWSHVDKSGDHWMWTGRTDGDGYGFFSLDGKQVGAHRVSYEIEHGSIPAGAFICHDCDRPGCVRPSCLYAGDALSNARDAGARNRYRARSGDMHPSRFHSHPVQMTPRALESSLIWRNERERLGLTQFQLAGALSTTITTISSIERGKTCPSLRITRRLAALTGKPLDALVASEVAASAGESHSVHT